MEDKENINENENVNIFDELSSDNGEDSILKTKGNRAKNKYLLVSRALQIISILGIVFILISFGYIQIQKNEKIFNNSAIAPFCKLFIGDLITESTGCSSISYMKKSIIERKQALINEQSKLILASLGPIYDRYNFIETKSVLFLSDKSSSRIQTLTILDKFDTLKNSFDYEKGKISCEDLTITEENILSAKCVAFSTGYENGIKGFDGVLTNVRGSSISIANSFLNYITKISDDFTIVERQKSFTSEDVISNTTGFTKKTTFELKLRFNSKTLSL